MITQFVVTLIIAGVWMFLQETPAWENFVVGFVIGLVVMQLAVRRLDTPFWLHRVLAFVKLSFVFLAEVVRSGVRVSYLILHPKLPISPGLVAVPLDVTSDEAITHFRRHDHDGAGFHFGGAVDDRVLVVHALSGRSAQGGRFQERL